MENIVETLNQIAATLEESDDRHNHYTAKDLVKAAEHIAAGKFYKASRWLSGIDKVVPAEILSFVSEKAEAPLKAVIERLGGNPDLMFVYEAGWHDEEEGGHRTSVGRRTLRACLIEIMEGRWDEEGGLDEILTERDFIERYRDTFDEDCHWFGTEEKHEKHEVAKRRKELEATASSVAAKHGVKVNTLEFLSCVQKEISAVEDAQDDWNNPECRMEEWAACQYAGVGQEVYFDDLNFENGRYGSRLNDLHGIMNWVSENCPLLWAQYEESRLTAKQEENEENEENEED